VSWLSILAGWFTSERDRAAGRSEVTAEQEKETADNLRSRAETDEKIRDMRPSDVRRELDAWVQSDDPGPGPRV
jgi:hypothetical protein